MADYTQFNLRGDTKSNWLNANPVLSDREIALETDTQRFKIGNGTSYYNQLPYGRNTGEYLNFYNVTALAPLTAGNYYTHETAILAVPSSERAKGTIVSYETASSVWYTERFIGSDVANWSVLANWEKVPDASDIAQLRSDLSIIDNALSVNIYIPTVISGKYIKMDGTLASSHPYYVTNPIKLNKGQLLIIKVGGLKDESVVIAETDENASFYKPVLVCQDNDMAVYKYLAKADIYVASSYNSFGYIHIIDSALFLNVYEEGLKIEECTISTPSFHNGKYITNTGTIATSSPYAYTDPVQVKTGDLIVFSATAGDSIQAAISLTDDSASYYKPVIIGKTGVTEYRYLVKEDGYIALSYMRTEKRELIVYHSYVIEALLKSKDEPVQLKYTTGSYINYFGAIATSNPYGKSQPIKLNKGDVFLFFCAGVPLEECIIAETDINASYYTPIEICKNSNIDSYSYIATEDCYIAVSFLRTQSFTAYIYSSKELLTLTSGLTTHNNVNMFNDDWSIFFLSSCICIGDSNTAGHIYDYPRTGESGLVVPAFSYPTQLAKMTQWQIQNAGVSGIDAIGWYNNEFTKYNYSDYDIAFIEFGYNGGLTDATQITAFENIIDGIKSQNSSIVIVLMISPFLENVRSGSSNVIKSVASSKGCYLIDLGDNTYMNLKEKKYHGYTNSVDFNNIHYNAVGYLAKAAFIFKHINRLFNINLKALNDTKSFV